MLGPEPSLVQQRPGISGRGQRTFLLEVFLLGLVLCLFFFGGQGWQCSDSLCSGTIPCGARGMVCVARNRTPACLAQGQRLNACPSTLSRPWCLEAAVSGLAVKPSGELMGSLLCARRCLRDFAYRDLKHRFALFPQGGLCFSGGGRHINRWSEEGCRNKY